MLSGGLYINLLRMNSLILEAEREKEIKLVKKARMVANTGCAEKAKHGNKVSKPLMEKKRRARINQCLDELKCLLESFYSSSIRKRKLEKADILELTVKHLRNLQKTQSCAAASSDFPDFQLGFRSCLTNVQQYLLMADSLSASDRWALAQLSGRLWRTRSRAEASSTTDSGQPDPPDARDQSGNVLHSGAEEVRTVASDEAHKLLSTATAPYLQSEDAPRSSNTKRAIVLAQSSAQRNSEGKNGNEAELSVWRPW